MANKNFETNMHRQMEDFKIQPSTEVWQNVEAQLQKDKRRRRWLFLWLPLMAVTVGMGWFVLNKQIAKNESTQMNEAVIADNDNTYLQSSPVITAEIKTPKEEIKTNATTETKQSTEKQTPMLLNNSFKNELKAKKSKSEKLSFKTKHEQLIAHIQVQPNVKNTIVPNQSIEKNERTDTVRTTAVPAYNAVTDTAIALQSSNEKIAGDTLQQPNLQPNDSILPAKKAEATKKKWQLGLQINTGISDIRTSLFPNAGFNADNTSYTQSGSSVGGQPGSGILVTDYAIKKNSQFGLGLVLRRKISATIFFVTGIQYQYSNFKITERQRRDSIAQPSNTLVTFFKKETTVSYSSHYIAVPTELQVQLAKTSKGSITLSAGIHHFIHIASSNSMKDNRLPGLLNVRSSFALQTSVKSAFYQPLLHIAPAYEWKEKQNTMQLGWYIHYGLTPMYKPSNYHLWQTGVSFRYFFAGK